MSLATAVASVAHDGKLAAKSQLSDVCKSKLSNVEKLLCDDSQLWFWLRLLEWKLVTTPLDELLLVHEFNRWTDGNVAVGTVSVISVWSCSTVGLAMEMCCCEWCVCGLVVRSASVRVIGGNGGSTASEKSFWDAFIDGLSLFEMTDAKEN